MYYIYVLKSKTHGTRYIGSTANLEHRIVEHNHGKCRYTGGRKPWSLIYQELFQARKEAVQRERFLKMGQGRKFLDSILT